PPALPSFPTRRSSDLVGLALAAAVSLPALLIAAAYLVLNIGYSAGLKRVVILDVFMIAGGFMLRILAGTAGIGIPPSNWLLVCRSEEHTSEPSHLGIS